MTRSVTCPRCGIRTQSKFTTDPIVEVVDE